MNDRLQDLWQAVKFFLWKLPWVALGLYIGWRLFA